MCPFVTHLSFLGTYLVHYSHTGTIRLLSIVNSRNLIDFLMSKWEKISLRNSGWPHLISRWTVNEPMIEDVFSRLDILEGILRVVSPSSFMRPSLMLALVIFLINHLERVLEKPGWRTSLLRQLRFPILLLSVVSRPCCYHVQRDYSKGGRNVCLRRRLGR